VPALPQSALVSGWLRFSGAGGQVQVPRQALMNGAGAAVFGDRLEAGRDVEQSHLDSLQQLFDRFLGTQGR
jgi:hypothetical protein